MNKKTPRQRKARKRPIQPEDLLRFRLISQPRVSPDGGQIVFTVKQPGPGSRYTSNLWMVSTGGSPPRQFTGGGRDSLPAWSPDGRQIAFLGARDRHRPQIYLIDAAGGEARPLTNFPEGSIAAFRWSPDGRLLAVRFREQDSLWTEEAKRARKEQELSDPPRVIDQLWYRLDGDGYFNAQRHQLYLVDADSGEHRVVYKRDALGSFSFDFSPDGRELVIATNRDRRALFRPWKDELLRLDIASGRLRPIRGLPAGPKCAVRWSPAGNQIAYAGREGKDGPYSTENLELWVCDPAGGGARSLTADHDVCLLATVLSDAGEAAFEPSIEYSPDGSRIYLGIGHQGQLHIASVPAAGGPLIFHTTGAAVHELGNVSCSGKQVAMTIGTPTRLAEVAVADGRRRQFQVKVLTEMNADLYRQVQLAEPRARWLTAGDGHRLQLWVMLPPGRQRRRRHPAVLQIHGGPHAQYGCGFFHEFQLLAGAGYAVFYSNPRGSKGYGRDHCAAIRGKWGTADWTDIQAVIRFMKEHPRVDSRRMGVMGGSYGGYMTNWTIAHCHDFAAAITDRCVSNLVSMSGNSDHPLRPDHYFPGNFWDRPEARWQQSPIAYFGNVKTPTLIIHSEGDLRCNIEQAEQVLTALQLRGVPCRMVRYPASTSHGLSRSGPPDLRIDRLRRILDWWQQHLM